MSSNPQQPYYRDPLREALDALEQAIELTPMPVPVGPCEPLLPDSTAKKLAMLENSIEGVTVPGPPPPPELPVAPMLPSLPLGGPRSPDPPALAEPREKDWPGLMAPPAARPFFTHEGLDARGYHPHASRSTGARATTSEPIRWCPDTAEHIAESKCSSCPNWGDHGSGLAECFFDWRRENENKAEEESENKE